MSAAMDAPATATARSRAYGLFSHLFLAGLSETLLPAVRAVPPLTAHLVDPFDGDEAAADHQRLFGFEVFACASVFLGEQAALGGIVTDRVVAAYRDGGYAYRDDGQWPDHVGRQLAFLAYLTGAEADAWEDHEIGHAARIAGLQRRFLDAHLLPWLPALVQAIGQQGQAFYARLADLALDLALDHRGDLGDDLVGGLSSPPVLPPPPDLMSDPRTGLKDIAAYLLTPAYSGLYLSRSDVGRLGKQHNLPRGFGDRRLMLTNLLRAAADYESLEPVLADLVRLVQQWQHGYLSLQGRGLPGVDAVAGAWLQRLATTLQLLKVMQAEA